METYPKAIDYTLMEVGSSVRLPKGKVSECPKCGLRGLRQVSSWSKGRYHVTYWHRATKPRPGEVPIVSESCSMRASAIRGLPLAERGKGRLG
jgi:hypothetical protein